MKKEMRVGVKSAWIQAVLGGTFLIAASLVTWWLTKPSKDKNGSQIQTIKEQKVDSGAINNYTAGRDVKIENNTYNNIIPKDSQIENSQQNKKVIYQKRQQQKKDSLKPQVKNQIVNNAPNQGTQIISDNTIVNVGKTQRILDDKLKVLLPIELNKRLERYGIDKTTKLAITAPMDDESRNFGVQIRDFLKSQGYDVYDNLNWYMGDGGAGKHDMVFKYDSARKKIELIINYKSK